MLLTKPIHLHLHLHPRPVHLRVYSTDPSIGARTGFGGVILHGLSTYGFAARHLVSAIGGNDPSSLKYFSARFTSPVRPGDELETRAWDLGALAGAGAFFRSSFHSSFVVLFFRPCFELGGSEGVLDGC